MFQSRGGGSLPSLIRGLRAAQQEGTEDEFLSICLQQIKEDLLPSSPPAGTRGGGGGAFSIMSRTPSPSARSTALLKLVYLQMLGFDVGFATFAVIEGMTVQSFTLKRPAYAAAALAFARPALSGGGRKEPTRKVGGEGEKGEEKEEEEEQVTKNFADEKSQQQQALSLLTTNLFKKDFNSKETHETSLALSTLSVMSTPEIANALLPDVLLLLSSSRPMLRKKAAVCCTRFLIQVPALLPSAFPKIRQQLMVEEDPTVISCLCSALLQLVEQKPQQYLALAPPLFHLLCSSTSNWLSLKLLKTFALLCPFEPRLPLKLLQPLLSLLQQSRAKSVEVEIIRLCLLHLPLQNAAETLAEARLSDASLAASAAGALTGDMGDSSSFSSDTKSKSLKGDTDGSADPAVTLLDLCISKIAALLSSADRNLRYIGVDIMASLFSSRREFARLLAALIPNFQQHVLQAAEECDSTIRSRGVELLANTATTASFPAIAEQLVTAASSQERQHHRRFQQQTKQSNAAAGGEASATTVAKIRADFLLPVLRLGAENHYALVEDFEWYLALLADIAVEGGTSPVLGCGAGGTDNSAVGGWCSKEGFLTGGSDAEQQVSLLVAEQLLDITVRVPGVRPCSVHLCSLLLDAAAPLIVPSLQNDSLEAVRRIHRSYRQQAGLHSPVTAADSELASSASEGTQHTTNADGVAGGSPGTSSYVAPVIIRAAAWIVGEYFQCISNFSDPSAPGDGSSDLTFYVDACRSLMKLACGLHLPAPVQQVVISAAVKVYLGTSASVVPATSNKQRSEPNVQLLRKVQQEMRVMLRRCRSNEAENTSGTNSVEVYDRVRLADQLLQFFGPSADPSMERIRIWSLQQENLLPVLPDAQQQVAMDPSLDLSIPFFDYRQLQSAPPSSSADPTGLASASGNTDTSPLNAGSPHKPWAAASLQDATAGSPPSKAPLPWGGSGRTPASAKKKFEVIKGAIAPTTTTAQKEAQAGPGRTLRESMGSGVSTSLSDAALQKGTDAAGCSPSAVGNTASSYQGFQRTLEPAMTAAAASLPLPQAMQAQLQQRLWQRSAEDDMLRVFTCTGPVTLPTAPDEPPALVLYACCEKKIEQSVEVQGVGLAFDEAADLRLPPVVPLASDLKKRSNKVTLKLCSFHSPLCCTSSMHLGNWQLQGQVLYSTMASKPTSSELQADESGPADTRAERGVLQQARAFAFRLEVPVTAALLPLRVNEDQLAHFLAQHASVISAQHSERVSVQALKPVPQPATSSPAWSLSIAGHSPTSPVAVLQYLRVVAASANMSLLPQQPIPVGDSSGALKCLFIGRLYDPDASMGTASLTELDGSQIVIAFVACQCTGGTSNEGAQSGSQKVENHDGNLASQEAGGCLQFRVNARSAGASCSQAICKQLCRLIEETAAGRLHVFTA